MPLGVRTLDHLESVIADYMEFDEFVIDVETKGEFRGNAHRNDVFWVSLAGPGRADAIPCGHPVGERIEYAEDDTQRRINPSNRHHQERRINPSSGREKWFDIPEPFTEPPSQLWVSEVTKSLKPLLFSERRKVGQNVKFDIESLAKYYNGNPPPGPFGDTLVAAKLINENHKGYDLGALVKREFNFAYEKIGKMGPEKFPYSEAHLYSYLDAKYTWLLWKEFIPLMKRENIRHIFDMEMDLLPVLIDMEHHGTPIDEAALDVLGREFSLELARLYLKLNAVYRTGDADHDINLNANRQKAELVYDILGKTCTVYTKSNERSTAKDTLEAFSRNKTVGMMLEHSALEKLHGTFVEGIKKTIADGLIHPDFNQVGAVSGRLSCRNPNIQQIPSRSERGKRLREVFIPRPGNVLVVSDLSQIELRTLAHFTNDRNLKKAYRDNLDLHSMTAELVFGKDFTPFQRSLAKNGNFSVVFGAGPGTMVRKYDFPNVRTAKQVLDGFYNSYKRVRPWKEEVIDAACKRYRKGKTPPYVTTILGRKRRLPGLLWLDQGLRSSAERQAVSVTISGSAADLFKLAMIRCEDLLDEVIWEGHILMTVHDELVVEVPEKYADEGLELVKTAMENIINPFTGESILSVPIVAEAKVVARWSDGK